MTLKLAVTFWIAVTGSVGIWGCSAAPPADPPGVEPVTAPNTSATGFSGIVRGAGDSVTTSVLGPYRYQFRQVDPASDRFTFQDRDVSFYFRPATSALHFQVANRQDASIWIEWDRCVFFGPNRGSNKVAHAATRWTGRYSAAAPTQILGLQRYGDYAFPMDFLVDPVDSEDQLHRPLFPSDESALQYSSAEFGLDLVFRIDNQLRTYAFRFRVGSVLPR